MTRWVAVLALVVVLAACGPGEQSVAPTDGGTTAPAETRVPEKIKVAFVTNNPSDFWTIAKAGTDKARDELGVEVLFRIPAQGTAQEQQRIVQELITVGASGIAISPKDPENQTEMLNEAAAEVNLITQDSDAPNSDRVCYLGTNNRDAGRAAAELIKQAFPDGGQIMLFVGTLDAQNAQDRIAGIRDGIEGTNIEIVDVRTDETDRLKAMSNVQGTLVAYPDVVCLVGLWSYNGPAILNGVRDSGKLGQVKIVAFDEEEETLQGVQDGHIVGTIVQQPFEFGYQSVKLLTALAEGDRSGVPESKQIYVPVMSITEENVDAFWANLKEQLGAS
jgi:ribose transport system substrate-binding protein